MGRRRKSPGVRARSPILRRRSCKPQNDANLIADDANGIRGDLYAACSRHGEDLAIVELALVFRAALAFEVFRFSQPVSGTPNGTFLPGDSKGGLTACPDGRKSRWTRFITPWL